MSKVGSIAQVQDVELGSQPQPSREAPSHAETPSGDQADMRLVIEEDQATGSFIYKTMNRRTGQIIQQFPREEILRLKQEQEYAAGAVVNTRA